jgi:hypothetical protein
LIALVDGENMVGKFEIMVVQVVEAMHLTFLMINYLEIILNKIFFYLRPIENEFDVN